MQPHPSPMSNSLEPSLPITYDHDEWPKMPDGTDFDGKQLLTLVRSGNSPFHGLWDVNLLIQEVEEALDARVIDIPFIYKGSNNYVSFRSKSSSSNSIPNLSSGGVDRVFISSCRIDRTSWPVCLETTSTCRISTAPRFISKFPRSSSKLQFISSCTQSLASWLPACFTIVSRSSTVVLNFISQRILRAATYSYLKEQRERIIYGGVSAQNNRCVPLSAISSVLFCSNRSYLC